jgi:hypothetical protein
VCSENDLKMDSLSKISSYNIMFLTTVTRLYFSSQRTHSSCTTELLYSLVNLAFSSIGITLGTKLMFHNTAIFWYLCGLFLAWLTIGKWLFLPLFFCCCFVCLFVFAVLGFKLRASHLSHSAWLSLSLSVFVCGYFDLSMGPQPVQEHSWGIGKEAYTNVAGLEGSA